jgi:hypothetical protein
MSRIVIVALLYHIHKRIDNKEFDTGLETDHSRQSSVEVKKWSCTPFPIRLHGVEFNELQLI